MTTTEPTTPVRYAMHTQPSEFGRMGADGLRDLVKRTTGQAPIATYAEEPPTSLSWETISRAGWDSAGIVDAGEGATSRDLIAIAKEWGYGCLPLPLLPTLLAKRHSPAARESEDPVTFAVPLGEGALVPFGAYNGIRFATTLGDNQGELVAVPAGDDDGLDLLSSARHISETTTMTAGVAREVALVFAAEVLGGAERLLNDSVAFVKEREQFGRPIGSFQAVKHKLATATVAVEAADTALIWGTEREENTYRAALFAVDRCVDAAEIAVQVHGGLGFTWEFGLHFPLRKMLSVRRLIESLQ